jgi:hypothetical protein
MNDFIVLAVAVAVAVSSWLLLALSDRLMGDKK